MDFALTIYCYCRSHASRAQQKVLHCKTNLQCLLFSTKLCNKQENSAGENYIVSKKIYRILHVDNELLLLIMFCSNFTGFYMQIMNCYFSLCFIHVETMRRKLGVLISFCPHYYYSASRMNDLGVCLICLWCHSCYWFQSK